MPTFSTEARAFSDRLRSGLLQRLSSNGTAIEQPADAPHPLLLLHHKTELAAFAVSNGDPSRCYKESYDYFKSSYSRNYKEWDQLDLNFVLCLESRQTETEKLSAEIETDVYFCRKFSIFADRPLDEELARLPFMPLEGGAVGATRPPSAESVLRGHGVPASLTAAIVLPSVRSAEGIVEDCLAGKHGAPTQTRASPHVGSREVRIGAETVRLLSIEIESFRAYRRQQILDLDADLVVIYGPNGFGKTSFFDAIDFAATGSIGRLSADSRQFNRIARHLDADVSSGVVTIATQAGGKLRRISRTIEQHSHALVDGVSADRKAILTALTGGGSTQTADRVDNMASLFRATHLFSQEFPSLARSFQETSGLSEEVVSKLLAFEDFVIARKKLSLVVAELNDRIATKDAEIDELKASLATDQADLRDLQARIISVATPGKVTTELADLERQLRNAGVNVAAGSGPSVETLREWRGLTERHIAETQSAGERLAALAQNITHVERLRIQVTEGQAQLELKRAACSEAEGALLNERNRLAELSGEIERVKASELEWSSRQHVVIWQQQNNPVFRRLLEDREKATAASNELKEIISAADAERSGFMARIAELGRRRSAENHAISSITGKLQRISELEESAGSYKEQLERRERLPQDLAGGMAAIQRIKAAAEPAQQEVDASRLAEAKAAAESSSKQRKQAELDEALQRLASFIEDGICPFCGDEHDSKEILLSKVAGRRRQAVEVGAGGTRLAEGAQRRSAAEVHLRKINDDLLSAQRFVRELETEGDALAKQIVEYWTQAEASGVILGDSPITSSANGAGFISIGAFAARRDVLLEEKIGREDAVRALDRELLSAQNAAATKDAELSALLARDEELSRSIVRIGDQILGIQNQADARGANANVLNDNLAEERSAIEGELRALEEKRRSNVSDLELQRSRCSGLVSRVELLRQECLNLEGSVTPSRNTIDRHERDLEILGLSRQATGDDVASAAAKSSSQLSMLQELRRTVIGTEIAIDSAAKSAAVSEKLERIAALEKRLEGLTTIAETGWRDHLQAMQKGLQSVQDEAVSSYTDKLGPLTTLIQRRLRSVPGFDDITLHAASGGSIRISVSRKSEFLRPSDYFSQSQRQILLLSVFVAACTTQTWSMFAPVLLDDPVSHFDDLNTYSFLDLLSGLVEGSAGSRQFLVSTCEERLFQLARQRFGRLKDRVKFYNFSSFTRDGPTIEQC